MEEKDEQIDNNSIKTNEHQIQSQNTKDNYLSRKRKLDKINLFSENVPNSRKTSFDTIFYTNKETSNSKDSSDKYDNYKVEEMTENDKKLMECFNYVKNNPELELNKKIVLNILNKEITLIILKRKSVICLLIDNEYFSFDTFAREIIFVNEKKKLKIKKFIYNTDILKSSLKELNFLSFYVKMPQSIKNNINLNINTEKESDSESSGEISLTPLQIYSNQDIINIYNENQKPILNEENYNNKFCNKILRLENLNYNSKFYYRYKENTFYELNNYDEILNNFYHFKDSSISRILYLYGPKRCSKTTFLLYMINIYRFTKTNTLYFNFNYLQKINNLQRKKIIYHELIYFCKDIEEMKVIDKKKEINNIIDKENIMELIYIIIKGLFEIISNKDENTRIFIIDNIHSIDEYNLNYLEKIISLIKCKSSNIKLILCGNGPYFNQKFINLYEGYNILQKGDNICKKEFLEIIYLYNADKDDINKIINEKEKKENEIKDKSILEKEYQTNIYSFYELYFSEELDKKTFSYKTIMENKKFISQLALEYFEIKILKNGISFNFYDESLKKCIRNIIGFEIEKGTLTYLLKRNDYPRTFLGVCFEKLITLLLMHNSLNLHNLNFDKNNIKEISEISLLKKEPYSGPKFDKLNKDEPILVVQDNFYGPLYDLLIITKRNNKYHSDFIQIGVDKDEQQINDIISDLESKSNSYKNNILEAFDIKIDCISVVFIFDYKTQKNKDFSSGFKICKTRNINFYLFSFIDCSLVELNDKKDLTILINEYDPKFLLEQIIKLNNIQRNKKKKGVNYNQITKYFHPK